jgi:hypothetical protein
VARKAIRDGPLPQVQHRADGSWTEVDEDARTGTTSLVTLALLTAGEAPDSPNVSRALAYLRNFDPNKPQQRLRRQPPDDGLRRRPRASVR